MLNPNVSSHRPPPKKTLLGIKYDQKIKYDMYIYIYTNIIKSRFAKENRHEGNIMELSYALRLDPPGIRHCCLLRWRPGVGQM